MDKYWVFPCKLHNWQIQICSRGCVDLPENSHHVAWFYATGWDSGQWHSFYASPTPMLQNCWGLACLICQMRAKIGSCRENPFTLAPYSALSEANPDSSWLLNLPKICPSLAEDFTEICFCSYLSEIYQRFALDLSLIC